MGGERIDDGAGFFAAPGEPSVGSTGSPGIAGMASAIFPDIGSMSILHLVSKPHRLGDCLARIGDGDDILLLHRGDLAHLAGYQPESFPAISIHVLQEPTEQEPGIDVSLRDRFELIDFAGFVKLTERHPTTLFWE